MKEKAIAERFRGVLETSPRRGTALDRLYGYHIERGTLDKLVGEYTDRTKANDKDGAAWMIVGLLESQRGRDAAAVAAFKQAEANLPDNSMTSYYLGQSLVLVGQPDAAAEAFERAITRKPNRNDLLDIFQSLGRVYQRAQRPEKALAVWTRLEQTFPDDARVQEQIAATLAEEGQLDQALPRYEKLAQIVKDPYRQTTFRMDAAELKVRLKRTSQALADLEGLLGTLNPENWLYRDVRRKVEEVFLRNDDLAGLAKYYDGWLQKNPADVEAMTRLARTLATQGRMTESRSWLEKAVQRAPTRRDLRQAMIDQLVYEHKYAEAAGQYEAMEKADPNNPDTLREWGKVLLRDAAKPEAERRQSAVAVWKRLLDRRPKDPVVAAQVADLVRVAGQTDEAIALYKKAIELAPGNPQYREYLGEYFHSLKRSEEALSTWRPIAEGTNRSAKNLARLAEVFSGFGYKKEAITVLADALTLAKDDFNLLLRHADLLHGENRHDEALVQLDGATKLITNAEEAESVLLAQIKAYQALDKLGEQIDELQKELDAGQGANADRWLRLARYFEANRQADKATETITRAGEQDPKSIPVLAAAARIYESGGNLLAAADANRKLSTLDRRFRTEYLTAVAKLEQRLGRRDQALQAGRDLLAASPGNPDVYKFFADLCFQLGDQEEGLEALRRSVRANPSDPQGLITLANALSERVRQGEAIELLWRAFEKTPELDGKLAVIGRLAQLYLENNQFDRMLERLERERREAEKAREVTMCIAQAYTTAGDLGTARAQLERLLAEDTRDSHLLTQLVALCEQEGDLAAAVKYQRQLTTGAPNSYDQQLRLAQLLTRTGEADEAADIWVKLSAGQAEPHRNLTAIDQLVTAGKPESALAILSRMQARFPGNWELLYREGAVLAARGKTDEAATRFNALLAVKVSDDELSEITKYQIQQAKKRQTQPGQVAQPLQATSAFSPSTQYDEALMPPLSRRTQRASQARYAIGIDSRNYYGGTQPPFYVPADYGEARMAAIGWLYEFDRPRDGGEAFVKELKNARDKAAADPRPLWDWFYFQTLRSETRTLVPTALILSQRGDPAGLLAYLRSLGSRGLPASGARRAGDEAKDNTPPLPADQLAHALTCYRKLKQLKPEWVTGDVTQFVMTEMKRSKKEEDEKALYQELVKEAVTVSKIQAALTVAAGRSDIDTCVELFGRLERLQPPAKSASTLSQLPTRQTSQALVTLMGKRVEAKQYADVRAVLDLYLASVRRQNLAAPRSASSRRRVQTGGMSVALYSPNQSYRRSQITYPSPNDYYDTGAITVLYNAFDLHKKVDLVSDLVAHVRKQIDATQGAERLYLQLALGYLHWWANEKDEAVDQLAAAVQTAPGDHDLLLEVAALREQNGEIDAALALLDTINPLDTNMMQRREEAALRLAERTGNVERARQAADRLFGLRLDADKQLELAGKMHRLGLHAAAETVLGRAQRQAGNRTATLVRLMTQYQGQNQTDLAIQIARQILRRGPSVTSNPYRGGDEIDQARTQAIGVLARSGQLKEMIERAEAQLKASPKSVQIQQALIDYYRAAGDKAKLKTAVLALADLRPDDGKFRYQAAQQLQQMGETDAALAQYKAAIKLDPVAFSNRYYEIQQLFAQANKFEELAQVFDEIDLRKLGHYHYVTEPIAGLLRDERGKEIGLKLFKKAWEAFPQYRSYMLGRLYGEDLWRLPEIYTYAKQAVIPRGDSEIDPWQSAAEIMSYGQEGRVDGVLSRMLSIARKQQRLPELRAEVQTALTQRPDWVGGKALLAVIDIQSGNKEQGRKEWQEVFADPKVDVPPLARFILSQELEFYAGVEDLAVKTMEGGIDELLKDGNYEFSYSPARRLVWWYEQLGRKDDAKKLLLRAAKTEANDPGYGGGYWQYRIVSGGVSVAQEMLKAGDPIEAVRIYNRLLTDRETLDEANQYSGDERFEQQIEQGLKAALKAIKPSTLPMAVNSLLAPVAAAPNGPAVDLVVLVESRDLSKAALNSVFAAAMRSTDKAPEIRRDALGRLAELATKHPTDFSVHTAAALAAFADGRPEGIRDAVDRLVKLAESSPLEHLPANGKANARQRAEAQPQVPLWLVARECLRADRTQFRAAGDALAVRAVAAARRQRDPLLAAIVLREWGQIELDRGDKAKAEARWNEMLELALPKPPPSRKADAGPPPVPPPALPAPVSQVRRATGRLTPTALRDTALQVKPAAVPATAPAAPSAPRGNVPALTPEQFQHSYEVALLAAEKNLPALSLRAMREAVRGGPPVAVKPNQRGGGRLTMRTINGVQYYVEDSSEAYISVDQALVNLVPKWRALGVPPADVYAVLAAAVLPDARPAEVFLYTDAPTFGQVYALSGGVWTQTDEPIEGNVEDRGLGRLLSEVAIEAGKADDLRARAEARAGQPLAELPARILLTTLALRAKDDARAVELFQALGERLKKDSQQGTNDRITAVLLPAFADSKFAAALAPHVEKAAENYAAGNNSPRATELRFKLAEYHLARKDEAAARAQIKVVEGFGVKVGQNVFDVHLPLARQYLKAAWAADGLRELGLHADALTAAGADPRQRNRRAEPVLDEFPRLVRVVLSMPAAERYAALKEWSLPTAGRKSIRYFVGFTPKHVPPASFVRLPPVPANQILSTMLLLAEAAKEVGKIDELVAEADKLAAEKVENAELFRVLVTLAAGRGKQAEPAVKAFAESARVRLTTKPELPLGMRYWDYESQQPSPVHPSELLFAFLCLADPALADHGAGLLEPMLTRARDNRNSEYPGNATNTQNYEYLTRIRAAEDRLKAVRAGAVAGDFDPGTPVSQRPATEGVPPHWHSATARSEWFAQDGYLIQTRNDQPSYLLFDAPLAGTFEFSVEVSQGYYAAGHLGYAGVAFEPNSDMMPSVTSVGTSERVHRPMAATGSAPFHRLTVQVSPGKVRCLMNRQLFFEDTDPPPTSPWLMLVSETGRRPVFRNFTLTGTPQVLPEVKLSDGDSLGGWMTHLSSGLIPQRLLLREQAEGRTTDQWGNAILPDAKQERVYDWQAKGGEIIGRKLNWPSDRPVPSKLAYFRPLRPGETLRYEFFYEPGKTHVHPSLGRLAFLLEPDGVRLHWLTDTADDWTGLPADNAIDDPAGRRGSKLPLKAGDWNAVALSTSADGVKIALNGTTIYDTNLGPEIERLFGLFHYRDRTAVRVRNVVLTGPWPKALPSADALALTAKPASPAEARSRRRQLGERYYFTEAGDVVARAKALPPAERAKALAEWVLPNETRPSFQLAGVMKPLDVLGVVDRPPQPDGRRVMLVGRFEAPGQELVAAAKEAGTLDALADGIAKLTTPGADDEFQRSKTALLAVARAAQGRDAEAAELLKQLLPFVEGLKPDAPGTERWPELIAVLGTLDRPALLRPATDLVVAMNKNLDLSMTQERPFDDRDWWLRACRVARARALVLAQADSVRRPYGSDAGLAHWASVPAPDAGSRSLGWGAPHWVYRDGAVTHYPGYGQDYLMLRTPLRGDFEVSCELLLQGWQEAYVRYGAHQFELTYDRKKYNLYTTLRASGRPVTITPPLPATATQTYQFKLVVKDGWFRALVDGREIVAEKVGPEPAPWLMLHCPYLHTGELRNVQITGNPTVPGTIDLLSGDDLGMWWAYLGQVAGSDTRNYEGNFWVKRGEEMYAFGRKPDPPDEGKPEPPRSFPETAVYYQRPLLEDGVIDYEFFYDPDRAHVHPTLDRLVFLLEPDGVRLHWLTDGANEKSGVSFDNAKDEPACRRGPSRLPLTPKAWNKIRLAVVGDAVKVALNGVEVYERPIEATNQRFFGLFHYSDRTEARVRSMTYSGDWSKQLPTNEGLFETKK